MSARVSALGFAARINTTAIKLPGAYNVIYSGADVPVQALQEVLKAVKDDIELHLVQPDIQLSNGLQNQIQIGSSTKVSCLPKIDVSTMTKLLGAKTMDEFRSQTSDLQSDSC